MAAAPNDGFGPVSRVMMGDFRPADELKAELADRKKRLLEASQLGNKGVVSQMLAAPGAGAGY